MSSISASEIIFNSNTKFRHQNPKTFLSDRPQYIKKKKEEDSRGIDWELTVLTGNGESTVGTVAALGVLVGVVKFCTWRPIKCGKEDSQPCHFLVLHCEQIRLLRRREPLETMMWDIVTSLWLFLMLCQSVIPFYDTGHRPRSMIVQWSCTVKLDAVLPIIALPPFCFRNNLAKGDKKKVELGG